MLKDDVDPEFLFSLALVINSIVFRYVFCVYVF